MNAKQLRKLREARDLLAGILETVRKAEHLVYSIPPGERSVRYQKACSAAGNATADCSLAISKIARAIDEQNGH